MKRLFGILILSSGLCLCTVAQAGFLRALFTGGFTIMGAGLGQVAGRTLGPKIAQYAKKEAPNALKKYISPKYRVAEDRITETAAMGGVIFGGLTFYGAATEG